MKSNKIKQWKSGVKTRENLRSSQEEANVHIVRA